MKPQKTLPVIAAIATVTLAGAAYAGPDWTTIERGRAAKQALQATGAQGNGGTLSLQNYGPRPQYLPQGGPGAKGSLTTASAR